MGDELMRRFVYCFVCTIVIGIIIYLGAKYQIHLGEKAKMTFEILPVMAFSSLFPIAIGVLLRLPAFLMEVKEKRPWTFDWAKIGAIGIPALYIACIPLLSFTSFAGSLPFIREIMLIGDSMLITTAGIVSGYILLHSIKR